MVNSFLCPVVAPFEKRLDNEMTDKSNNKGVCEIFMRSCVFQA